MEQQREVSIFWSYANCPLPSWAKAADASKSIVGAVSKYGRIVDRRLYCDFAKSEGSLWSALDSSGFDLVNTNELTLDKKLIADVLCFAWDSALRNDNCKPVVVLLTNDVDYTYTLSKLLDRGIMTVVMHGSDSEVLRASTDISMNFELILKSALSTDADDTVTAALALCKVILQELAKDKTNHENWIFGSKVGMAFRSTIKDDGSLSGDDFKERYKQARALAVKKGWLVQGRRSRTGSNKGEIVVIPADGSGSNPSLYSKEDFMSVTPQGNAALTETEKSPNKEATSCSNLFLKNIPRALQILDLVKYLEQQHNCVVLRGNTEKGPPMTPYCFARIQLENPQDAARIISLAKSSKVRLNDRSLQVSYDKTARQYAGDPAFYYERSKTIHEKPSGGLESPPSVIRNTSSTLEVDINVLALCKTIFYCEQEGNLNNKGKWMDGGGIAAKFRETLKSDGHLAEENSDKAKELFKNIRSDAISKALVETGRRVKLADRTGDIEVVTKDSNTARYTKELYIRITDKGRQLVEFNAANSNLSTNSSINNSQKGLHVFFKMLPANTPVRSLVQFLEKNHGCSVQRASIDALRGKSTVYCNAHVEFEHTRDAAKILKRGSTKDGLLYKGKPFVVVPDQRIPSDKGSNPMTFYDKSKSNQVPIPTTVSTVPQSFENLSVSTPEANNDGQASNGESPSVSSDFDNDKPLFCAVIHTMCPTALGTPPAWQATGLVGANFQKKLKGTVEEEKERFKKSRDEVISQGLVEMGRRKLDSDAREITVAPYFSETSSVPKNLSSETYLRLTEKGLELAKEAIESYQVNLTSSQPKHQATNIYLSNLPRGTHIKALVEFVEKTFEMSILRACIDPLHPSAKVASAHIEFQTAQDAKTVFNAAKDQDSVGLIYGGRTLRTYLDRKVPNWSKCNLHSLYEIKQEKGNQNDKNIDENKTREGNGEGYPTKGTLELSLSKEPMTVETSVCDTTTDSTITAPSPSKSFTTDSAEENRMKLENLDTTDLLFGDNLALLYAQIEDTNSENNDTYTEHHHQQHHDMDNLQVPISVLGGGDSNMSNAVLSPIRKAPDVLW